MTKRLLHSFIFLMSIALQFSCHNSQEKADQKDSVPDSQYIHIALLPTLDCLPMYYAQQEGIFDSLGVHVKLRTYKAAMDADTAFCHQSADAIMTDVVKACIWRGQGDSVSIVMSTQLDLYLLTAYSARIRQASSLKEKIIAITRNSSVDMFTDLILEQANMLSTDLNKPQINNMMLRCQMVDQNQYDGAILPEPYASECEARGARRLTGTRDMSLNLSAFVIKDSVLNRHKDDITRIREAYAIAAERLNAQVAYFNGCKGDTALMQSDKAPRLGIMNYIPKKYRVDIPDTLLQCPTFLPPSTPSDSAMAKAMRWCRGRTLLKKEFDTKSLIK